MESARVTFYLFDELVAEEEELYDKRVKTLANHLEGLMNLGRRKARGTKHWNRAPFKLNRDLPVFRTFS